MEADGGPTFIQTNIPEELFEAAKLDGANHFQCFYKIVMPLGRTIIAVLAVYYGVSEWNDYFTGLVCLRNRGLYPPRPHGAGCMAV